jgi:TusA-related sulfurtransferase
MEQLYERKSLPNIDHRLDITGDVCPLTFVKTKLLIERMAPGQIAEVRLKGSEPLENVPKSLKELGHAILSLEAEAPAQGPGGVYRLVVKKEAR